MNSDIPTAILIKIETIKERCGNCLRPFVMETYLDTVTEKRSRIIRCEYCKYKVPQEEDY